MAAPNSVRIVTHGASGLEVQDSNSQVWCDAIQANNLRDTCGSGDMVSVGIIDWMLARHVTAEKVSLNSIFGGIIAGQRLAAANCAYAGARGIFKHRGASYARAMLMAED